MSVRERLTMVESVAIIGTIIAVGIVWALAWEAIHLAGRTIHVLT